MKVGILYLMWLPAVVLLVASHLFPLLPTGDRRDETWADPRVFCFRVGFYYFIAMLAVTAAWWARSMAAKENANRNVCAVCGYDLRATPHQCPECGAVRDGNTKI